MARSGSDQPFFRCAVNVDVAAKRIDVLRFASSQPKDARDDRIATGRICRHDFARADSILEYGAKWRVITDRFCDLQWAQWRAAASQVIAQSELRSRDRIRGTEGAAVQDGEVLVAGADDEGMLRVRRRAGGEQ